MNVTIVAAATAALVAASSAGAENWRVSSSADGARGYIDVDSIRRDGDRVRFVREVRWPSASTLEDGSRFDRIASLYEADCRAMTLRSLTVSARLGGEVVLEGEGSGELEHVAPGSTGEIDLRSACFGDWPEGD